MDYLAHISRGRLILWFYFIWYLVVLYCYFDPSPRLWLTSLGLGLIVGFALYTNAVGAGDRKGDLSAWQTFRFFLTPFCVSSFSALVKDRGFILVFSPHLSEIAAGVACCAALGLLVFLSKRSARAGAGS